MPYKSFLYGITDTYTDKRGNHSKAQFLPSHGDIRDVLKHSSNGKAWTPAVLQRDTKQGYWLETKNFKHAQIVALDIDNNSIDIIPNYPHVMRYASGAYVTASGNGFRVIYVLPDPVHTAIEFKATIQRIADASGLPYDTACIDAVKRYYGATDCRVWINENVQPLPEFSALLDIGANIPTPPQKRDITQLNALPDNIVNFPVSERGQYNYIPCPSCQHAHDATRPRAVRYADSNLVYCFKCGNVVGGVRHGDELPDNTPDAIAIRPYVFVALRGTDGHRNALNWHLLRHLNTYNDAIAVLMDVYGVKRDTAQGYLADGANAGLWIHNGYTDEFTPVDEGVLREIVAQLLAIRDIDELNEYTLTDAVWIPGTALRTLSPSAIAIASLKSAYGKNGKDTPVSIECTQLGISRATYYRAMDILTASGIIHRTRVYRIDADTNDATQQPNRYTGTWQRVGLRYNCEGVLFLMLERIKRDEMRHTIKHIRDTLHALPATGTDNQTGRIETPLPDAITGVKTWTFNKLRGTDTDEAIINAVVGFNAHIDKINERKAAQ